MIPAELARLAEQVAPHRAQNVTFVEFCRHLNVQLTPGQRRVVRVAYDGEEPAGDAMWGGVSAFPPALRKVLVAVCGARGGKSYVFSALRLLWGALTRDLDRLRPGQEAIALIVAPDIRLGHEVLRYVSGAVKADAALASLIVRETTDSVVLRRDDGHVVSIECLPATRGGRAVRGRWITDAVLDECAFFRDEGYQVNDAEIFRAVAPRVLPGGQIILASTPWAESGLLFDMYRDNWGHPVTAMAVTATTLELNPAMAADVARERLRDPDNAEREFGAKFMRSGSERFFDEALLDRCEDATLVLPRLPLPGEEVVAGADLGFRRDSSALVIAHRGHKIVRIAEILELKPEDGTPLKPSEVVRTFGARVKAHKGSYVMADQHYRETLAEHLSDFDLGYSAAPSTPSDAYVAARQVMREGIVRIPVAPRLRQQLREVVARPQPGGGLSILMPRKPAGGHGDIASAFVLALCQAGGDVVAAPELAVGTKEWEDAQRARRRQERLAEQDKPWWRKGRGR